MTQAFADSIAERCGIHTTGYAQVHGGDINEAYCLQGPGINYFLKLNDSVSCPAMFVREAAGLSAINHTNRIATPAVIDQGVLADKQWLLLQWVEKGITPAGAMENFGTALAAMHLQPQLFFGWHTDNYIGSLLQVNTRCSGWTECYTEYRIMPLVKILFDKKFIVTADLRAAAAFCKHAAGLFPEEPPSLLHGDLWGGNFMINTEGQAVVFDPAVYNGHREMDIGMTKLFGGFSQGFYDAYQEQYPLQPDWQTRLPFTQLYPLLVHAVLFGGHYLNKSLEILHRL
ncbi:MAG: fructosamine kinase family protein [Chitinophagaceae bacterium]